MKVQNTPLQKKLEINVGVQNFLVEFTVQYRQFDWLEISLVYYDSLGWGCNGCLTAPLSKYANNQIF